MGSLFADSASIAVIVGVLAPPFIAILQQPRWSAGVRTFVTLIVAAVSGVIVAASQGALDSGKITAATIALVLVTAQATYASLWKKIGVTGKIEGATSPGSDSSTSRSSHL